MKEKEIKVERRIKVKLEIVQYDDGQMTIQASGENEVSTQEAVGILEIAKFDIIAKMGAGNNEPELVEVTINEADLLLDSTGFLKKQGLGVGDKMMMPKAIAEAREQSQKIASE